MWSSVILFSKKENFEKLLLVESRNNGETSGMLRKVLGGQEQIEEANKVF